MHRKLFLLVVALVALGLPSASALEPVDLACTTVRALGCTTWYVDADGDGYGDPATAHQSPLEPQGQITRGGDCNDADANVHPGAVESFDGRDEDCDGSTDEVVLVLSELMVNPNVVADTAGEWVELANASAESARLDGVAVVVGTRSCPLEGTIGAGSRLVVARSADTPTNGGVTPQAVCSLTLTNSGAAVRITAPAAELDAVDYTGWTVPVGASLSLAPDAHLPVSNDTTTSWCAAVSTMAGGDRGTPGVANDPCA